MVKASSDQEDSIESISTAMFVHYVSKHPTQGKAKRSRLIKISHQAKTCCSCTRSSDCKVKLCECKRVGTACQRCNCFRVCASQPEWVTRLKELEATEEQEKTAEDITKISAATTAPKRPSPKAKGSIRRSPNRVSILAKATTCEFDGCVGCYLCQPAILSPTESKKTGERTLWPERIRKRQINNQLEAGKSNNEKDNLMFADFNHAAEDNEEKEVETVKAPTTTPPVEQRAVELASATTPPQPTLLQTSLQKIEAAYGAVLHHNDGTQLDGSIADDKLWQAYWREIVPLLPQHYDVPAGRVGRIFIDALAKELEGVEGGRWNSKRFTVFQAVVLQRTADICRARGIQQPVKRRIIDWHADQYRMIIEDTTRTIHAMVSKVARRMSEEAISKTFTSLVLKGKIRTAVRFVTLRGAGGVLSPDNIDAKSGQPVVDVLLEKHPVPIIPAVEVLKHYNVVPEFVPINITEDTVEQVSGQLTGAAGPGGIDVASLQQWLLRFGVVSQRLHRAVMLLACLMANNIPPWAATRALLTNQLMALDKCPGIRLIGIGEI